MKHEDGLALLLVGLVTLVYLMGVLSACVWFMR